MRKLSALLVGVTLLMILTQCKSTKEGGKQKDEAISISQAPSPGMVIYKTKANYRKNVPVILSDDKTKISSYPAPRDLMKDGKLRYPTKLENEFLLDNRGIDQNVAFLNITYDQYTKLGAPPTPDQLIDMILDNDPLNSMYRCGRKAEYSNPVDAFNEMIRNNDFSECEKLK